MASLLNLNNDLWLQIAQYLSLQKYALFTALNKAIRTAVNTMPLDYSDCILSFYDIEECCSRYSQLIGLNLQVTVTVLYERVNGTLFNKLKRLKLDLENCSFSFKLGSLKLELSYRLENFDSLQVLHLNNCQNTITLNSKNIPSSLTEIKIENFSKLVSIPLLEHCLQLQKIILRDCPLLATVGSIDSQLEEVNITDCFKLEHFPFLHVNNFYYRGSYFDTASCSRTETLKHLYVNDAVFKMEKLLPLESLSITNCKLFKLSSIPTLKDLKIYGCGISELSLLPALETLDVGSCLKLTNITLLSKCKNLCSIITCGINPVTCPQVNTLTMFSNMNFVGSDLSLLQHNTNLTILELHSNRLSSLEGICTLNQLTTLTLTGGEITSLQGVENCTSLINLILRDIPYLTDISALKSCTNLQKINFEYLRVEDVTVLTHLIRLHTLRISHCSNVIELPSLAQCGRLENLNLNHSEITTLPALSTSIRHLNVSVSFRLQHIQCVSKCTNLVTLNLFKCRSVIDITAIPYSDILQVDLSESGAGELVLALLRLMFPK